MPACQPYPSHQLLARPSASTHKFTSSPPELRPKALRAPSFEPEKVVHQPTAVGNVLQSACRAVTRLSEARVINKPSLVEQIHFPVARRKRHRLLAASPYNCDDDASDWNLVYRPLDRPLPGAMQLPVVESSQIHSCPTSRHCRANHMYVEVGH